MNKQEILRLTKAMIRNDGLYFAAAKKMSVSENTMCLFYALYYGGELSQKQLSEEWLIPKTTVNTLVKEWETEGYVRLEAIPGKRRERRIALTEQGMAEAERVLAPIVQAEEAAMAKVLEKYSAEFIDALECFNREFQKETEGEMR